MKIVITTAVSLITFLVSASISMAFIFGPKDFDSCVKKYASSAKTELAARMVISTCRQEFRENKRDRKSQKFYECIRNDAAMANTETAARVIQIRCSKLRD